MVTDNSKGGLRAQGSFGTESLQKTKSVKMTPKAGESPQLSAFSQPGFERQSSAGSLESAAQDDDLCCFIVHTTEDGRCCGKLFCFRAESKEECDKWIAQIRAQ
eukprot:1174121-Rhodomonas_salina.1